MERRHVLAGLARRRWHHALRPPPPRPGALGGGFSHQGLPGTRALLSARGPAARLILQVILSLPLTSSPPSQQRNNGAKGERALGTPHGPLRSWGSAGAAAGHPGGQGAGYGDGHPHERGFSRQVPPPEPPKRAGAAVTAAGRGPALRCQGVTQCGTKQRLRQRAAPAPRCSAAPHCSAAPRSELGAGKTCGLGEQQHKYLNKVNVRN